MNTDKTKQNCTQAYLIQTAENQRQEKILEKEIRGKCNYTLPIEEQGLTVSLHCNSEAV